MEGEGESEFTPGFRFYPTEEELIAFYLAHKLRGTKKLHEEINRVIPELHVYDFCPSDLPKYAGECCQGDPEQWFFFISRQEKESRPSRLTSLGYWKATGSPSIVYSSSNRAIGIKRTMVFYKGRVPHGTKTKWKMNEYKAFQEEHSSITNPTPKVLEKLSLCRVYVKSSCLRAFDRRPSGVAISEQGNLSNENHAIASTTRFC